MATWPASLPQTLPIRHGDAPFREEDRLRDEMDQGPPAQRPAGSAPVRVIPGCELVLTNAQKATFDAFVRDTLKHGSDAFDWPDPLGEGAGTVVVQLGESPPRSEPLSQSHHLVQFDLEILP